jgi:histidyl-tRNA synthetase
MPSANKINALRGMHDVFSTEYTIQNHIKDSLQTHLRGYGYTAIDLPIIENTELYLRKSGEDIASRLYEFNFKSRRIALRPEVTASILRAYVDKMQDDPLPIRLQYTGPVFRYEKPQQDRYRQFTMTGAEMLGAKGAIADAEMLYMACSGLEKLGITSYKLVIGHTEILEDFLHKLGLRQQLLNFLLRNMENIRKRGLPYVIESLREIFPELEFTAESIQNDVADDDDKGQQLLHILREMSNEEAHQAVTEFLHSLNIKIDTNRDEYDVIDRLLHKIREDEQGPKLRMALDYMQKLSELVGKPEQVLSDARNLLQDYDLGPDTVVKIENLLETLSWYDDLQGDIELDLGMNRGLHYYTGLMFEVHYPSDGTEDIQLCGGGRYDKLITVLGGNTPTPALGFAYGIERIARVMDTANLSQQTSPDIYMIPLEAPDYAYAFSIANLLRENGHIVEVSIDTRNLKKSLKHADKRQARIVMIIGSAERDSQTVVMRDMQQHTEQTIPYDKVAKTVEGLLTNHV